MPPLLSEIDVPRRLRHRPRERGFVVPWFVPEIDGHYDFRVMDGARLRQAIREQRCWICGEPLGRFLVFTVGPMCAVNRTSAEPPSHRECAEYAARVCPFLTQRQEFRRADGLPEEAQSPAGLRIARQPGVALLWVTKEFRLHVVRPDPANGVQGGLLFEIGEPSETVWLREGRPATRAEVEESIDTGYPLLLAEAEAEGPDAVAELERRREVIARLLPGE